jgi:hypothetical protein
MLKKHLVVLLLMVMAVGASAQSIPSGTGRIEALGNSPFILDAATDISNNPAWNNYYRYYAFGDFGRDVISDFALTNQYAGVTFGVGKKWNLGLILNKRSDNWDAFNDSTNGYSPGPYGIGAPIVPFMGLIGYTASKTFSLGLAPYYAAWSRKTTTTDTSGETGGNHDLSSHSIGANLGFMYMIKKGWIEGAVEFRMNKYKSIFTLGSTTVTTDNTGGMLIGVNLRGWIYPSKSSKVAIVPVLSFSTYSWQPEQISTITRTGLNYSNLNIGGGVGLNWPVVDDIQLAGGFVLNYNSAKADSGNVTLKATNFMAPRFNLAGETRIADWLTARFGYSRSVSLYDYTATAGSNTNEISGTLPSPDDQTASVGAGFHFGRFSIDATVSEKWLKHGINFISGNNGSNTDLFGVISASYNFNTK